MQTAVRHKPVILPRPTQCRHGFGVFILALSVIAGCATVDEAEEYARADARIRAVEQFEAFKHACRASGGVVVYQGSLGRLSNATPMDLSMASCASPLRR